MGKFRDLTGQQFGEWTVLKYVGHSYWECQCSCGKVSNVLSKTLVNGKSKSCGHSTANLRDLTNQIFGDWTVLNYSGDSKWLCECSCGELREVLSYDLTHHKSTNCGHTRKAKIAERNSESRNKLEGTQINDWTVLKYLGDKKYLCRCSCGKIREVSSAELIDGRSKSCGHNNGKLRMKDITGEKFGKLEIIGYIGDKTWECKCECGKTTQVLKGNLLNGSVKSCGCSQYDRITKEEFINAITDYNSTFGEAPFISDLSRALNRHEAHIRRYINSYELNGLLNQVYSSKAERDLYSLYGQGILHDRTVLNGKELDILYPDKRIAIEFNGTYWHSSLYKNANYHQEKTLECAKQGIRLIHIFQYEWENEDKRRKLISLLNSLLKDTQNRKVYARTTQIKLVNTDETKKFLDKYHLQGYSSSIVNLGCYSGDELLGVLTFGKPRFNNNYQWEIIRLAWMDQVNVVGGAEKLFQYFIKNYNPESILTYCDISKFTGNVYIRLGFKHDKNYITNPNYVWVNSSTGKTLTRYQTQKKDLVANGLGEYGDTESEIMSNLGWLKIYDCGNLRFIWTKE